MSTYEILRQFAATWGLAYFSVIFIVVVVYALWPSKGAAFDEAARIPLRED
ncbi:cbb3-type cytochrome c oxidase subunit 3 [Methylocella silvestris]|uniref:CcoQ/FixQ family Cbb3-type cytochrome c oxidase assembly chaperone n=1 Tax=Methylocella silvestris TaxID=199596 RepID=A0A2J7TLR7_METSI|nr:cbb3-type cytochrome c oxidase subunit 3 [Methylocella silvestris]PNG27713.1 CcoQ/FixQ family Cbb3-type cytochrome c oxidase assembly chaperone [Methylocella silvestris]